MEQINGKINILVADDDKNILRVMTLRLESEGFNITTAKNLEESVKKAIENAFDLALVDLKLDKECGINLMKELHQINPEMPIIIMTGHGTVDSAVEAMRKGAYSFIQKPFDHHELLLQIENCVEGKRILKNVQNLQPTFNKEFGFETVVGKSEIMKKVLGQAVQAAETDSSVYIEGESGTGKELIARIVHAVSPRKNKPFIVINCAAIPETLFESELFGFEKGAFTGAEHKKVGLFSQADGGTFFLDEISEMPLFMQTKLLRVVQEGEFYPLGGNKLVKVDTRLISTSNRNLKNEVENGNFREDLFYRIHVISIKLPPLRERKEDIPLLADHFLKKFCRKNNKNIKGFSTQAMQKLSLYAWPGNIRELKNEVESTVVMARKDVITEENILTGQTEKLLPLKSLKAAKADFERKYLIRLIEKVGGNITKAADISGKYRADLYQLFKKHGLNPSEFRKNE